MPLSCLYHAIMLYHVVCGGVWELAVGSVNGLELKPAPAIFGVHASLQMGKGSLVDGF